MDEVLGWGLVTLFIALFIAQSIIFAALLLRLRKKLHSIKAQEEASLD